MHIIYTVDGLGDIEDAFYRLHMKAVSAVREW
jgi:hypothetical protein